MAVLFSLSEEALPLGGGSCPRVQQWPPSLTGHNIELRGLRGLALKQSTEVLVQRV